MQNKFDFSGNLVNHGKWSSKLLLWGVTTCKHKAVVNAYRLNGVPLGLVAGEIKDIQQAISWLKAFIAVLCGSFVNSLAIYEGEHLKLNSFLVVKTVLSGACVALDLFQPESERELMNNKIIKSKSKNKKQCRDAVIFMDYYTRAELPEIENLCSENNLQVKCIIYNYILHEVKPYREIIKYIASQKQPPVVVIDSKTCLLPECIMSSTVLGTLEEMQLAEIHICDKNYKQNKLTIDAKPAFNLLKEATYQLQSIQQISKENVENAKKGGK